MVCRLRTRTCRQRPCCTMRSVALSSHPGRAAEEAERDEADAGWGPDATVSWSRHERELLDSLGPPPVLEVGAEDPRSTAHRSTTQRVLRTALRMRPNCAATPRQG